MPKGKEFDLDSPTPVIGDEDEKTLAAIDVGIRDAEAGRTIPIKKSPPGFAQGDYRILFTQRALNDLAEIIGRITEDDGEADSRVGSALLDHVDLLSRFPRMGGAIRKRSRVRKLQHSPVLVYYRIREDNHFVEILHFRHGSRKSPPD